MSTIINSFLSGLREVARHLNPSIFNAFPEDQAVTIWTEGGEWPAYSECYESYNPCEIVRDIESLPYIRATTIEEAMNAVENNFGNHREAAISMDCGLGKSTTLVRELHSAKYARRTIVVEPSSLVAASLAKYLDRTDVASVQLECHMSSSRGIYYMSAGVFMHMTMTDNIYASDLIILDEAHTCTFMYDVVKEFMSRTQHRLVLMTASTSNQIKALKAVTVVDIRNKRGCDPVAEVTAHGEHIIVGVHDDSTYAAPANAIVGATLPGLRSIYDTALRPEPRVHKGSVIPGERKATVSEVIQMLGRVGRTDSRGTVYYNSAPIAMRDQTGLPLYDVLRKAMMTYLKLIPGDRELAMRIWINSGISSDNVSRAPMPIADLDSGQSQDTTSMSSSPVQESTNVDRGVNESNVVTAPSYLTTVINARPFMRANVDHVTPLRVNDASLRRYWTNVLTAMAHGDSVFPEPLRIDTSSQVDVITQDECRMIISGRILPDFTEREMLGVIAVWNKYVHSLRGRPADINRLSMFTKYFSEAYSFDEYRFRC